MAEAALEDDWPRTVPDFEAWHARQPERWEFVCGQPRLTAPGSKPHTIIKGNVFRALDRPLGGTPCHVFVEGVQILTDEISAIPNAVVSCAPVDLAAPVVAEPTIIVEVMSPSSEADDTHRKWFSYRKIPAWGTISWWRRTSAWSRFTPARATSGASASSAAAPSSSRTRRSASTSPTCTWQPIWPHSGAGVHGRAERKRAASGSLIPDLGPLLRAGGGG